jgi:hypothetical protein
MDCNRRLLGLKCGQVKHQLPVRRLQEIQSVMAANSGTLLAIKAIPLLVCPLEVEVLGGWVE